MESLTHLIGYVLASMGLTVLFVWPGKGPTAWMRDKILRNMLPGKMDGILDCYVCFGFWAALLMSCVWWYMFRHAWLWFGCLMVPGAIWIVLQFKPVSSHAESAEEPP